MVGTEMTGLAAALGLAVAAGIDPYLTVAAVGLLGWLAGSAAAPAWAAVGPVLAVAGGMGLLSVLDPPLPGSARERLEWIVAPAAAVALAGSVAGSGGTAVGTTLPAIGAAFLAGGARRLLRRLRGGGPEGLPALFAAALALTSLRLPVAGLLLGFVTLAGSWSAVSREVGSTREALALLISPPRRSPDEPAPPGADGG